MQQQKINNKDNSYRLFFFVGIVIILAILLLSLNRILIPLGIAYIFSMMLGPVRKSFNSVSIGKKTFTIIFTMVMGFMIFYPLAKGIQTLGQEAHKIEYYAPKLEQYARTKYNDFRMEVQKRFNYEIKINPVDNIIEIVQENTKAVFIYLPYIVTALLEWGFMIPLFLFFIVRDGRRLRFQFLKLVPNSIVERTYYLFHQFNTKFGDYIFAKFIEAAIVGTIITTGLLIIDYPFAFLLGLVAALTNILPYFGPILGFIPALVVGLVDQNPNTTLGAMAILYIVANVIDLALVFPILVSKIVNLHPIVVVISVILGSQVAGVLGMIVSIPMAAFVKLLFIEIYRELYTKSYH